MERKVAQRASGRRSGTKRWLVRYPKALPIAIFALITAITILSVFAIERGENQRQAAQLRSRTVAVASALERRANSSSAYLRAGAALLASLDDIPPERFGTFVSELRLDSDYRGAEGIGWAPVVYPDDLQAFEERLSEEGGGPVRVAPRPSGSRPYLTPIAYLQPETVSNQAAVGFDMFSDPVRRAAMLQAELTARPTATERVMTIQPNEEQNAGFLIYMPVFEAASGGRRLKGFIFSPFNAQNFLSSALELEEAGAFAVNLYDGELRQDNLLASSGVVISEAQDTAIETLSIANNPWALEMTAAEPAGLSGLSMATLVFGLLVASLLMLLVRMLTQQAMEDEASLTWFEEQASIRNSLTRELNHRVKNTLANVLSIIALTRRRATDVKDFADGLDGRIRALSATHDLLTDSGWATTPVRSVVEAELLPYAQGSDHTVDRRGPAVELAPNDALSLGLAMHELATNAAKYGALSRPGGRLTVDWRLVSETLLRIEWLERGGPPVAEKRGRGFGTDLIERIVAHELKNPVDLSFEREGVRCVLLIPVRRPSEFAMRAAKPAEQTSPPANVAMQA